jgi:hypothetical protein
MRAAKHILAVLGTLALVGIAVPAAHARIESELASPDKRRVTVERAVQLARQTAVKPLPTEIPLPFAPAGFDLTDAEEAAAAAAAARSAAANNPGAALLPPPPTDRQLLESIVAKIAPSGSIYPPGGGKPVLIFGKRLVKTGSHFTVTYKGADYDLELTDIDGSNYTLRYNREEITRPIQTGKTP